MTREGQPPQGGAETLHAKVGLSAEERMAVTLRADLRRRDQGLRINVLNLELSGATDAMRAVYNEQAEAMKREAGGSGALASEAIADHQKYIADMLDKANRVGEIFPELAALCFAEAVKAEQLPLSKTNRGTAELSLEYLLSLARDASDRAADIPKTTPGGLLPDAILLGVQKRLAEGRQLPASEKIAKVVQYDNQLLAEWALVMSEYDRANFLALIPDDKREAVSQALDIAVAPLLHQAVVGKKSGEENQRRVVRSRIYQELQTLVGQKKFDKRKITRQLAEALGTLGEDTRQLLLEVIRDETEKNTGEDKIEPGHLPRVVKVFLDNFDDWRGNDVILRLAGDPRLDRHLAVYLLGKLIDKGYLPKDVKEWWREQQAVGKISRRKFAEGERVTAAAADEERRLEVIRGVVADLGVMPSKEILEFIHNDQNWKTKNIGERIAEIRARQTEFARFADVRSLVEHLNANEHTAMIYYLLHGGEDRFNLINNYSFAKFREMLGLIAKLEVHETPLTQFENALKKGGLKKDAIKDIRERLEAGHFPLRSEAQGYQEVSFEVSENAAVKNANAEIGRVLGRHELGVALLFPLYREYLEREPSNRPRGLLERMRQAITFADREQLLSDIDHAFPTWRGRAGNDLADHWKKLGEKMLLEATIDNVLTDERVAIRGEELIPRLDAKRFDLKKMKKDLLVALRGGNERSQAVASEIARKKKALGGLRKGLASPKAKDRPRMEQQIADIEAELAKLEQERAVIADMKVEERFADLSPEERRQKIDEIGKEIIALTEKSPSAIFTFITMQVLGEERLRNSDVALIQELESHLQGPFQTIQDALTYQRPAGLRGEVKKRQRVGLRYVDKPKQLMHMVRFADSKICCFSSNNYEMVVQHNTPNKFWVASINADPLSFVIAMELPQATSTEAAGRERRENVGFIFGNFAVDDEGLPATMLNGIYYAPGIEDSTQVAAILDGVRRIFKGLPIKSEALASQFGGAVQMPEGFTNDAVTLTRLRALDDGSGNPETKIYDDLGTGNHLNRPLAYNAGEQKNVWHAP